MEGVMTRTRLFGLLTVGLLALATTGEAKGQPPAGGDHAKHFQECAKACDDCARSCDTCANHCAKLVADGQKHHLATLKTCQDCAAVCRAASTVVAKQGPFSDVVCTACAEACKRCGDACEKHGGNDPTMKACADECKKCEKACRDMLLHLGHGAPAPKGQ